MVGLAVQLSVAAGASARAAAKPAASLHSTVRSRLVAAVVTVGTVSSRTVMVWCALLLLPQPSLKVQVRVMISGWLGQPAPPLSLSTPVTVMSPLHASCAVRLPAAGTVARH